MLEVLRQTSESVFVPLTIGGGIRDITDATGKVVTPALEVVGEYFRSGADKVSIGSDAVYSTEKYLKGIREACSISEISRVYGVQAVVISVDPKRVYVSNPQDCNHEVLKTDRVGPKGECYCWYQCTVKGGRESRDIDIRQLITTSIILGAGEILLNCIDNDGQNSGFDLELVRYVKSFCTIPVIASSGAGKVEHFSDVFETGVEAALAAGIFHRGEVEVGDVKEFVGKMGYKIRI
jgi:glutamine amidotransferase/cyclase